MNENKKPDFINRQKAFAAWKNEYKGKETINIKDERHGTYFTLYLNEDKTTVDKLKDKIPPQPVFTEEKVSSE